MKTLEFFRELNRLAVQIRTLKNSIHYDRYSDCSELETDYNNPDEKQLANEFENIMEKLNDVQLVIKELNATIKYESSLFKNSSDKYEDGHGHYYCCGYGIEYLYVPDDEDEKPYWRFSSVEHNGEDYYIVGDRRRKLDGLLTRVRGN